MSFAFLIALSMVSEPTASMIEFAYSTCISSSIFSMAFNLASGSDSFSASSSFDLYFVSILFHMSFVFTPFFSASFLIVPINSVIRGIDSIFSLISSMP